MSMSAIFIRTKYPTAIDPAAYHDAAALHQAIAAVAERHIRGHLDQWCIFRPLWDTPAVPAAAGA